MESVFRACGESAQRPQLQLKAPATTDSSCKQECRYVPHLSDDMAFVTHFMDLVSFPVALIDRSDRIRFLNRAASSLSKDYRSALGKDLSALFPRKSDWLAVKALVENMGCCPHAQIEEGEMLVLSERVNCKILLSTVVVSNEEFTVLVLEDRTLVKKVSIVDEQCKTLVAAVPAGVAQFELPSPVPRTAPYDALLTAIMSAQLKMGNDPFASMHGFSGIDELRGALASELVQPSRTTESAFKRWVEQGLPLYQTKLKSDCVDSKAPDMELILAANTNDTSLLSYWVLKRRLEKRHGEQALLGSFGGQFQTVFEHVDNLILLKDLDSRYLEANPATQRLLGIGPDAIRGKSPEDVWGSHSGRKIRDSDSRTRKGVTTEHICQIDKGIKAKVHLIVTPMRDLTGDIVGSFEIGRLMQSPWNELEVLGSQVFSKSRKRSLVCRSAAMRKTLETAWSAAKTEGTILLTGETGSGKDYLAQLIHKLSNRAAEPMLSINCAAVPHHLAESELFGHEPGAFTGAKKQKKGMLELATGGTLLMNEIGDFTTSTAGQAVDLPRHEVRIESRGHRADPGRCTNSRCN